MALLNPNASPWSGSRPIDPAEAKLWRSGWSGPPEARVQPEERHLGWLVAIGRLFRRRGRGFVLRHGLRLLGRDNAPTSTPWGGRFLARRGEATFLLGVVYEPLETAVMWRLLEPGMCLVDVGANQGWYTVLGANRVGPAGRVVALEPSGLAMSALRANLALNRLEARVDLLGVAASDVDGEAELVECRDLALSHLGSAAESAEVGSAVKPVVTARLDTVLAELRIKAVDVVKIDVEGVEAKVLGGLAAQLAGPQPPLLLLEVVEKNLNRYGSSVDRLLELLAQLSGDRYDALFLCRRHGRAEAAASACRDSATNLLAVPKTQAAFVQARLFAS